MARAPGTRSDPRRPRPRVVMIDDEGRESFRELAGALRRLGFSVLRVVPPGSLDRSAQARVLDSLVFGPALDVDVSPTDDSPSAAALRRSLFAPPTVDVHAPEQVAARLALTPEWREQTRLLKIDPRLPQDLIYDKLEVSRFAQTHGVPVPEILTGTPGVWPVVVKGRQGFGGRRVRIVSEPDRLERAVEELSDTEEGEAFVQRFLPGGVTSSGGVCDHGRVTALGVWRVFPDPDEPLGPPARITIVDDGEVAAATVRLMAALGYTGMFNLNFVHDATGTPLLIDVNCRVFGSWQAAQSAGLDVARAFAALHGLTAPPPPARLHAGAEHPVVRIAYISGDSVTGLARSALATQAAIWERRDPLGWRWALTTEARMLRQAASQGWRLTARWR